MADLHTDDSDLLDFGLALFRFGGVNGAKPHTVDTTIDKVQAELAEQVRAAPFKAEALGLEGPR